MLCSGYATVVPKVYMNATVGIQLTKNKCPYLYRLFRLPVSECSEIALLD